MNNITNIFRRNLQSFFLVVTIFLFFLLSIPCQESWAYKSRVERIKERIGEKWQKRIEARQERRDLRKKDALSELGGRDYDFSLLHDSRTRMYKVHTPPSYTRATRVPLIFAFHGGGGSSEIMANDEYYGLISKSNQAGFIVVFPNGASRLKSGKFATWNAGHCCGYARDNDIDDVGFVRAMVQDLHDKFNVDANRIYAVGMSNGGMFSYRLACDLSDIFSAVVSVAGTDNYDSCHPQNPISIMHIHAADDDHVLFNGGAGAGAFRDRTKVTDFTSVPETIKRWRNRNKCLPEPKRVMQEEGVYCDEYDDCENNVRVKLCVTEDGAHSWPGEQKTPSRKTKLPSQSLSAVDEIWRFLN